MVGEVLVVVVVVLVEGVVTQVTGVVVVGVTAPREMSGKWFTESVTVGSVRITARLPLRTTTGQSKTSTSLTLGFFTSLREVPSTGPELRSGSLTSRLRCQ